MKKGTIRQVAPFHAFGGESLRSGSVFARPALSQGQLSNGLGSHIKWAPQNKNHDKSLIKLV